MPRIWRISSPRSTPPRRPTRRAALRAALALLALGLVAIVLIAFGWFPQARVTRLIETRAKQALGEDSRIGRMRVVPARGEAEVWDSVIAGPGYRVELPRAKFVFGLGALFGGALVIQKLELQNPRVVIDPVAGSGGAKGRPITVLDLVVSHGSLLYKDLAGGDLALHDVSGSGAIGRGILELRAASGEWRRPSRVPLGPLQARVALTPRLEARLDSLDAATGSSRIHLSGALGALSDPVLDLAFEADVDLVDAQLFGVPAGTKGRVRSRGRISGSPKDLRVEADASSPRVDLGGLTLHAVRADLELGGDTGRTLQLASHVSASVHDGWEGTTRATGTISGSFTPASARSELRWRAAVERRKAGTRALGPGFVTANAEGTAVAGAPLRIEGRLAGDVVSPSASGPLRVPFTGTFAAQGTRIAADFDLQQAAGFLRASLDVSAGEIRRLRLRGQELDLAALLGAGGRASLQADFSGQPRRATGTAAVTVRGLAYRGSDLGDAELSLQLRDGTGPLRLRLPALNVRGSGELRLAGAGSLRAALTLERTPLQPLVTAFSDSPQPATGELTALADVNASLDEWKRAEVRLRASQLTLASGGMQARAGPFTAVAKDGVAQVDGLSVELPGGRFEASGRLALGEGTNDLTLAVAADLQSVAPPQGWHLEGKASGRLRLTGTHRRPWLVGNVQLVDTLLRRGARIRILELPKAELLAQGDRVVFTDVTATLAGGSLKSGGEIPLATVAPALFPPGDLPRPARLLAEWTDVRAGVLSRAFGWRGDQVVEAALSGQLSLAGSRARLADLTGHARLAAVHGTAAGVAFDAEEIAVVVERGLATLESFTLRTGAATLRGNATLDVRSRALAGAASGNVDLRALSALTSPAYLAGNAAVDLKLAGTLSDPRPSGRITLERASARSPEFTQALTDMRGVLLLEHGVWRLEDVSGRFGGGDVAVSGSARPAGPSTWSAVNFAITAKDVALRYPEDFKSRLSADLRLIGESGALRLVGDVLVDGGLYDTDIFLDRALVATDESLLQGVLSPLRESLAPLRAVGLDLQARLGSPFLVRNNLAKLALSGQLRIRGDLAEPLPYGRLEIAEGGVLFLQTRTFTVEGGSLIFEGTQEPSVSVRAQGVIKQAGQEDVAVTVAASGPLARPHLSLASDPPYTEREIASLIATGRRNVALDSSAWVAGEHTAALLAGRLTRNVQRGLLDLGLDEVDIQPELLARETNPGARFTFGKNITPAMKLIFSRGLNDPEATFYQLEYRMRALRDVTARVSSDDNGIFSYGLGQRFRWGGPKRAESGLLQEKRVTLRAVRFTGDPPLAESLLRGAIKVEPGDDVTPWDIQDDAERLERLLVEAQYIEALVSARLEDDSAVFAIAAGPRFRHEVVGMPQPPPLDRMLREARFEGDALERGRQLLLEQARARGYGRARVDAAARDDVGWRTLVFRVELGALARVAVSFPGARALPADRLIAAAGGVSEFLTTPQRARRLVTRAYRQALFLGARVGEPEVSESPDRSSVSIAVPVTEGPKAKIARVRFDGAQVPESVLLPLTSIAPGSEYAEEAVLRAVQQVREHYLKNGYAAVRLRHRLVPAPPDLELHFQVTEGERDTIGPVVVTGLRRTRESLLRNRIDLKQGEPLDPRRLVELERRLMELGMFSRVAVSATGDNPRTIKVELEERGQYAINYDVRFSQDERATALLDGEIGNLAGLGIVAGGRYRQGQYLREVRGSLVLPALGRARGITLSVFDREQEIGPTGEPRRRDSVGPFEQRTERGAGLQHSMQLRNKWEAVYSYTLKRVGTSALGGLEKNLGVLDASLVADTRDDPLNPTRGTFWSVNVGLAPKVLGSQLPFTRAMGQLSWARPAGRRLTWAQSYRVGVGTVLRGKTLEEIRLIGRSEGFRAGGGSSVRGYATDSLGPTDLLPGTAAGDAVLVVNQELRYQLPAGFGAAVFYDGGNVFPRAEDLGLKLRHSAGVGVRYLSPFGLVRLDVGFPIARRPGERPYQLFLSVGQAF